MKQQKEGSINMTSLAARNGGGGGTVSTFTRGLAKELVDNNIRVNGIVPEIITAPF